MSTDTIIMHASMIACWLALSAWAIVRAIYGRRPGWLLFATGFMFGAAYRMVVLLGSAGLVGWGRWEVLAFPVGIILCMALGMYATRGEQWCQTCPLRLEREERDALESTK